MPFTFLAAYQERNVDISPSIKSSAEKMCWTDYLGIVTRNKAFILTVSIISVVLVIVMISCYLILTPESKSDVFSEEKENIPRIKSRKGFRDNDFTNSDKRAAAFLPFSPTLSSLREEEKRIKPHDYIELEESHEEDNQDESDDERENKTVTQETTECALIAHGRRPVEGNICITFEDINQAILSAKKKLGGFVPPEVYELSSNLPKAVHVSASAEIIEEATRMLTCRFGLPKHVVLYQLPLVDTSRTSAKDICPSFLLPVKCEMTRYRTLTGMCNNLNYPSWGAARTAMIRLIPADYADGIGAPRRASDGHPLPSPRRVSFILHQDASQADSHITYLAVAFGQIVDHDLTFAPITRGPSSKELECCGRPEHARHPACLPIEVPKDDPFYKFFQRSCMEFARVQPSLKPTCPLGPRNPANIISSFLDANYIYGSSQEVASRLREKKGGRLKSHSAHKDQGYKDLLPLNTHNPDQGCERTGRPRNESCFDAGDERVNQQLPLTVTHTIFLREHNRIADYLQQFNPTWSDDKVYQETRRIVIAELQHIIYNEWLPVILGKKIMTAYGLELVKSGFYNGYDDEVNPSIRLAFQAAAFRFGHSILPENIEKYNKHHRKEGSMRLSTLLRQPYELYKEGAVDSFLLGLLNQEAARMDAEVTAEVTNNLFKKPGAQFGQDLAAINILRGRETGLPGYNAFREYCGLNRFRYWTELLGSFDNRTINRMQKLYRNIDDIDLWSAGISETPTPGALVGPVFSCIIAEQFTSLRRGDRFWYENYGQFTDEQLTEIRKVKMAAIVCDNSDDIDTVQIFPFLMADPEDNPRVPCQDIPRMDLSKFSEWDEDGMIS